MTDGALLPSNPRAQQERFGIGLQFQDFAVIHFKRGGDQRHRLVEQGSQFPGGERAPTKCGNRSLLIQTDPQFSLNLPVFADVVVNRRDS